MKACNLLKIVCACFLFPGLASAKCVEEVRMTSLVSDDAPTCYLQEFVALPEHSVRRLGRTHKAQKRACEPYVDAGEAPGRITRA